MNFCGVTHIPTFDNPTPMADLPQPGEIGHACQGKQIEPCRKFLERFSRDHVADSEVMRVTLCLPCREGKR